MAMHQNVGGKRSKMTNGGDKELPVCPKPLRPHSAVPEFLYSPLTCNHSYYSSNHGSNQILEMMPGKSEQGRESTAIGCSPSCYCGSPPTRSSNPLVHDTQFLHQMEMLSPFNPTKLDFTSASRS